MSDGEQQSADVVIVGGGVMGSSIAYHLASRGVRPLLLEQRRIGDAPSASGASAAMVTVLADHDAPVRAQSQLSRRLLRDLAPRLLERTGIDVEYRRLGSIRLAFSEQEAGDLRGGALARHTELDEPAEWLDARVVRDAEPAAPETILGGLHIPSAESVYAPKYVRALAAASAALGATVQQGVSVNGFTVAGNRVTEVHTTLGTIAAGQVVLATGAWTGAVADWLGASVPVVPQRGQIVALAPEAGQPRVAKLLLTAFGYVAPKANGTVVVGATHEFVGFDARVTTAGIRYLADLALRLAPGLSAATLKHAWAGFRPMMVEGDGLPAVGRLPGLDNAYVAAGHGAIGVNLAAAVGHQLAQLLLGEEPDLSLAPFAPGRLLS
jgi:glycine oxidase